MLSVPDARARILAAFAPLPPETLPVTDALGRVLAEDLTARVTQPPAAMSAMDGYAVRARDVADVPARLTIVAEIPAGQDFPHSLGPGECVRIFTGAPLPDGADSIVIQEDTTREGDTVTVHESIEPGQWVRPAGLDFMEGHAGLRAGRRLSARDIGLAAAMNRPWLQVRRRPRVAILATGDEVVLPGEPVGPNQIVSSNSVGLCAFVRACGGTPVHLGIAPDTRSDLGERIAAAKGCDLLVTAGGASVGEHDLVQAVLTDSGADLDFWKIAMRPGKPLMFGKLDRTPVLGLPGNPVSGLVCSTLFLRPAIEVMQGRPGTVPTARATLGAALPANGQRESYLRGCINSDNGAADGDPVVTAFQKQDSSVLSRLADADVLIIRPAHAPAADAGSPVDIVPLDQGAVRI
jgi:molybdopterin molybdotransferase